jgi:hypothetical protein
VARLAVIASIVLASAHASAEPRVAIRATGACPSAAAIERALPSRVRVAPDGELLVVEEVEGGAIVRMTTATGPIDARLESHDCTVLAGAVAAVADAWFVELPAHAAPSPPPLLAPEERAQRDVVRPVVSPRVSPRWHLAAGRALVVEPERADATAATQIDAGWWTRWRDVRLNARFAWGGTSELATADAMTTVNRRTWGLALTLGPRAGRDRFWLEAAGGAALVVARVSGGTAQESGEVVRLQGAVAGLLAAGLRIGGGASLRFDVSALVYPIRDRYTLPPVTVAKSPLTDLAASVGLEVAFGERIW